MTRFWRPMMLMLAFAACTTAREPAPPAHEFLVSAGDSTFWVRGERSEAEGGLLVRGSPILLARLDGRFYELYVADDDRSYYDAILIGQRVYRRDLLSGDSLLVYEDSLVPALARGWARRNPSAVPLGPSEDASDDPETYATAELEIIDLHGPYLSYEYHADIEMRTGDESHLTRWGVLDIRTGRVATLAMLYGQPRAKQLEAEGRRLLAAVIDSLLAAPGAADRRTVDALAGFAFDPRSFTILQLAGESAVAFLVPGHEPQAGGLTLELDPIPAGSPAWWQDLRANLPEETDDPLIDRWRRPTYDVLARYTEPGDSALLAIHAAAREWPIASVPAPVQRIEWLDAPPLDSATRRALGRAFDEAVLYDESARVVRRDPATPLHLVSHQGRVVAPSVPPRRIAASTRHRTSSPHRPR